MYAEYGAYPGDFVAIGFNPEGFIRYRVTAVDNSGTVPMGLPVDPEGDCVTTQNNGVSCNGYDYTARWQEDVSATAATSNGSCVPRTLNSNFVTCASASFDGGATFDVWRINASKDLQQTDAGF